MRERTAGRVAWVLWGLAMLALATAAWLDHLLREAGRSNLPVFAAAALAVAVPHLGLATVGAVIAAADRATRWAGCCYSPSAWSGRRASLSPGTRITGS